MVNVLVLYGYNVTERETLEATLLTAAQIAQTIKDTRMRMGVTQEQIATAAGTGLRFIVDLENGKPTCQVGKVLTVLQTLGIKITLTPPQLQTPEIARAVGRGK